MSKTSQLEAMRTQRHLTSSTRLTLEIRRHTGLRRWRQDLPATHHPLARPSEISPWQELNQKKMTDSLQQDLGIHLRQTHMQLMQQGKFPMKERCQHQQLLAKQPASHQGRHTDYVRRQQARRWRLAGKPQEQTRFSNCVGRSGLRPRGGHHQGEYRRQEPVRRMSLKTDRILHSGQVQEL